MADWLPERLPEDIDAERSFLATCCAPGAGFVASEAVFTLAEEDFVHPAHRAVFRALKTLIEAQVEVNSLTLKDALDQDDSLNKVGGYPGLVELLAGEDVERPQVLADVIRRKAKLRRLVHLGAQLVRQAAEEAEPPEVLVDQTAQSLFHLAQGDAKARGLLSIQAVADDAMERLADRLEGRLSPGVRVGFSRFDELTQGFQPGNLIVLAARPGIGKTALALNWVLRAAQERDGRPGHCGAFFSLEMSHEEVFLRLLAAQSQTNMKDLQSGRAAGRLDQVMRCRDELVQMPLFICDQASITVPQIQNMIVKQGSQSNRRVEFVIVDYLQLLSSPEGSRGSKQNEAVRIGEISRGLKLMAKDFGIPVVVLSQLNREVEHRVGGRPQLSDLRDCVTGETAVLLTDGSRTPIRDLVGTAPWVWAMTSEGRLVEAQAERIWRVGERPTQQLRLASGRDLRCTDRHRLWTQEGWKRVLELTPGDRIALARHIPAPRGPLRWDDQKVALLGQLIGDGSYLPHQPLRYTTASEENSLLVREAAESCFGCVVNRHAGRGAWHQLVISGNGNRWKPRGVNAWLRELGIFGQRGYEKRIPAEAFRLGDEQTGLLLRHLWATDGTISLGADGKGMVHFSTSSRQLALDVSFLLLRLGMVARIQTVLSKSARPTHMVWLTGVHNQRRFLERVGTFGPRVEPGARLAMALDGVKGNTNVDTLPREVFAAIRETMKVRGVSTRRMAALRGASYNGTAAYRFTPSRALAEQYSTLLEDPNLTEVAHSDLFWDRLVAIEAGPIEEVFDLTVPGPSSWLADGLVSHNSGAIEQDADMVAFIHRKMMPSATDEPDNSAELIVAKHRNGPTAIIQLHFQGEFAMYREMVRETSSFA